ncbi:hydroxysteroid 11-beta-dehydrogenase 1-like protein [Athene noctua]|uniref:hydroxysteroid 11-beta-dehydrogenase 1-like protein n=1 Tax=Athene noctua TaxID=126797 RepID=UPI003EBE85AA
MTGRAAASAGKSGRAGGCHGSRAPPLPSAAAALGPPGPFLQTLLLLPCLLPSRVNFFCYVALATAALPTLEKNKGPLGAVPSLTGEIVTPFTTSYSATKFALDGFFSSLRHELITQKRNVSLTLRIRALINTDMVLQNTRCDKVHRTASPVPETALTIIQGGATRVQEVFYPWWLQHMCCLWVLLPNDRDQVLQSYYNYSSP